MKRYWNATGSRPAVALNASGGDYQCFEGYFIPLVRSEGLEPPRFYSLPPQGSASTNSATSAWETGRLLAPGRINGADVTNQDWGDKASNHPDSEEIWAERVLPGARQPRQHLLDLDRDSVAVDQHHAAGDRQIVGEDFDLVRFGRIELDDGAARQPHHLVDRHRRGAEHDHEIDGYLIESCDHFRTAGP
jgi:hypothetical protein